MDSNERSVQAQFGMTRRSQFDQSEFGLSLHPVCQEYDPGFVKNSGTGNGFTQLIKYAKRCHSMKSFERTVITKERASSLQSS